MTSLIIDLPTSVYERMRDIAEQQHMTVEAMAQGWLTEKAVAETALCERERLRAVLRAAGKLTESTSS